MDRRFESELERTSPEFQKLVRSVPLQSSPPLPEYWLRCEMLERYVVLRRALPTPGATVLEVGAGPHAISTVPLAFVVGPRGRVVAVERRRWGKFREIASAGGMMDRIRPLACDARRLPLRSGAVDLAVCLHGLRSLPDDATAVAVLREMLRVSGRIVLAETLPISRTDAQRAHLAMYGLREEVFLAATGRRDDVGYRSLDAIASLVDRAGGVAESPIAVDVDLPHALAYFPRDVAERIVDPADRARLVAQWDAANAALEQYGEDHPPVGIVQARPR